ncbi:hypothetical protein QBC44DRAFT_335189 [Cladorrhinum sp. PSN332]|nr:hypothetical protein QBC44DRAFT_335189 [Cladorrhinum sp. PSN332]
MLRILNEEEGYDIGEREVQRIRTRHNLLLREVGGYGQPKHTLARRKRELAAERAARRAAGQHVEGDDEESGESGEDGDEEEEEEEEEQPHAQSQVQNNTMSGGYEQQQSGGYHHTANYGHGDYGGIHNLQVHNLVSHDGGQDYGYHQQHAGGYGHESYHQQQAWPAPVQTQEQAAAANPIPEPHDLDEFVAHRQAEREQKRRQLEQEAQERWATKKRRRHTKPYGVLPADPPCAPRFPSETTLSEAKEILQLDAPAYATIREKFMNICNNAGVTKKTLCGPERWEQLKDQLVRESMHLRAALWDPDNAEQKKLAVEIIANDVTKRIRTMNRKMTVVEAKSILGLNPIQGRDIRAEMYNILVAERFTAKLEEGVERCRALRQRWINGNDILKDIVESEGRDPDWDRKMKAINVLARDAERRYQDDVFRKGKIPGGPRTPTPEPKPKPPPKPRPAKKAKTPKQTAPEPAPVLSSAPQQGAETPVAAVNTVRAVSQASTEVVTPAPGSTPAPLADGLIPGLTLPPSMAKKRRGRPRKKAKEAASAPVHTEARFLPEAHQDDDQMLMDAQLGSEMLLTSETQNPFVNDQYVQGYAAAHHQQRQQAVQTSHQGNPPAASAPPQATAPTSSKSSLVAVYFRLHTATRVLFPDAPVQWIHPLTSRTFSDIREAATRKTPGAMCFQVEGIIKDGQGGELPLPVTDDMELQAYFEHVQGHGAPTFNVHLVPGM